MHLYVKSVATKACWLGALVCSVRVSCSAVLTMFDREAADKRFLRDMISAQALGPHDALAKCRSQKKLWEKHEHIYFTTRVGSGSCHRDAPVSPQTRHPMNNTTHP